MLTPEGWGRGQSHTNHMALEEGKRSPFPLSEGMLIKTNVRVLGGSQKEPASSFSIVKFKLAFQLELES